MNIQNGAYPYFEKKEPWSSHWYIRHWLEKFKPGTRVLDIGTASGILGQSLKDSGFILTGLEPNRAWAQMAKPYYHNFFQGTVEEASPELLQGQDVVILADILEHLQDPRCVLKRLLDLQASGCIFIVSVPNIANISIRLNLLFGRFEYQDRGILDQTHFRLFTRRTLLRLLESAGLEILDCQVTPVPLELVHPFFVQSPVGKPLYAGLFHLTRLFPTLLGYQFVVKARKPIQRQG
jgi:2-polyprenyl-3-methyl-5-hydroxy-6-metoxy-1,4-benzoquinol methylase